MSNEPTVTPVAYGILASYVDPESMTLLGGGYLAVGLNHDLGSVQVAMTDTHRGLVEVIHLWPVGDDVVQALNAAAESPTATGTWVHASTNTRRAHVLTVEIGVDPELTDEVYLSGGFAVGMVFLGHSAVRMLAAAVRAVRAVRAAMEVAA